MITISRKTRLLNSTLQQSLVKNGIGYSSSRIQRIQIKVLLFLSIFLNIFKQVFPSVAACLFTKCFSQQAVLPMLYLKCDICTSFQIHSGYMVVYIRILPRIEFRRKSLWNHVSLQLECQNLHFHAYVETRR